MEPLWSSDQFNWTNLYLLNKFGEYKPISTKDTLNHLTQIFVVKEKTQAISLFYANTKYIGYGWGWGV